MYKSVISRLFAISALLAVSFVGESNAVICESAQRIFHVCVGEPHEVSWGSTRDDPVGHPAIRRDLYWIRDDNDLTAPKCYTNLCKAGPLSSIHCGINCTSPSQGCDYCIEGDGTSQEQVVKNWMAKYGLVKQHIHIFP